MQSNAKERPALRTARPRNPTNAMSVAAASVPSPSAQKLTPERRGPFWQSVGEAIEAALAGIGGVP